MSADLDALVATQTSLYDSEERLVAQTTQIQAVRAPVA
jgi:hypothetical protein